MPMSSREDQGDRTAVVWRTVWAGLGPPPSSDSPACDKRPPARFADESRAGASISLGHSLASYRFKGNEADPAEASRGEEGFAR